MKKYSVQNYIRYKNDVKASIARLEGKMWDEYTREELIIKFLPLVENISRKFSTSHQASGVMTVMDMIQSGHVGLIQAAKKLDYEYRSSKYILKGLVSSSSVRQRVPSY